MFSVPAPNSSQTRAMGRYLLQPNAGTAVMQFVVLYPRILPLAAPVSYVRLHAPTTIRRGCPFLPTKYTGEICA